ncbi:phosphonate ABC transporter, periplasmic phosphonate binding protein [Desulfocapsa sulfexigens DSM 10523]|uniref:Phosphonate ABC transporter, periplasmic phosphonate binding protein n=1 Tax=Desulfocapsa sulfexigens (strain DSM 10523 / SB164P1) TaxID=1167006 RepID=M1P3P3_DESSD|nr:phosphonate ABC transporter substrate-binding protein [Desulfocapsa sulfexigens]AGF78088.1 phosphonate ABC transporter, periplasmic phosphonate binding protein [Desulfocapsa sulfexigens DSM 10523]
MKRLIMTVMVLFTLATLTTASAAVKEGWPETLTYGVIPVASSRNMSDSFGGLVQHLEKELGIKVKLQVAGDYAGVITGMQHGHIDLAYLGPKSYCEAAIRAGAEALVVEVGQSGVAGYHGYIITKAGSGLNSLDDLKGKKWAFTDPHSTSGTLVPTVYFNNINISPEKYFGKVIYSGSHEASILSVKAGKVDGASTNDLDFDRGLGTHWNKDDFNIIWTSDLIPGSPMAARADLPASLKQAIQEAFISYQDKDGLEKLKISGFQKADDKLYDGIRELIALKKALKERVANK